MQEAPPPAVLHQASPLLVDSREPPGFKRRAVQILGILQIAFGCGAIILEALFVHGLMTHYIMIFSGIWCGAYVSHIVIL
jgi:hypothetical protein